MEHLLQQLGQRYIQYSDIDFSFSLLKSINFFYLYLHQNGDGSISVEIKENPINIQLQFPKTQDIVSKLKLKEHIIHTLLEGFWDGNFFYCTDLLVYNGKLLNHNFKVRNTLLKKFLNENFVYNHCLSMTKIYNNVSLDELYSDIIPQLKIKVHYILIKKNFQQYVIPINKNEKDVYVEKKKKEIKINIEEMQNQQTYRILATKTTEIYLIDHGSIYSVLRVPDIKTSMFLKEQFINNKEVYLPLIYNKKLKKYEYKI